MRCLPTLRQTLVPDRLVQCLLQYPEAQAPSLVTALMAGLVKSVALA